MAWRLEGARPPTLPGHVVCKICFVPVGIICIVRRVCERMAGMADGWAPRGARPPALPGRIVRKY
jgi:hypothetical protein